MSGRDDERLERLRLHRELEYLRSVGRFAKKRRRHMKKDAYTKARARVDERAAKLDALPGQSPKRLPKPQKGVGSSDASS